MDSSSGFDNRINLHHIGYVVASIEKIADDFARSLQLVWDGRIFNDPLQGVRVSFFQQAQGSPMIELVEPESKASPAYSLLRRGGGLHHLCYEVDSLEKQLNFAR